MDDQIQDGAIEGIEHLTEAPKAYSYTYVQEMGLNAINNWIILQGHASNCAMIVSRIPNCRTQCSCGFNVIEAIEYLRRNLEKRKLLSE